MILQVVTTLTSSPLSREDSLLGGFRFKPSEQYAKVKLDHLPRDRGENKESFCPPPTDSGMDSKRLQMQQTQGPTTPSSPSATTILTPDLLQELYGQLGSALLVALVDGHGTWPSGKPAWLPPGGTEMKMFGPKEVDKNMDKNTIRKRMATFPLGVGKIETIVSSYSFLLAIIWGMWLFTNHGQ